MFPTITLGPLVLPTAGLVYIVGAWIVLTVIERSAKALKLDAESTYTLSVVGLASGLIGARLVFVILHWTAYQGNLFSIFWPLTSGFDQWGGIIIGSMAAFFYGRGKRLPFWATLDGLAPGFLAALIFVSLADFLAGPGYGTETSLPWAINLFSIRRHPVQIYEIIVGLLAMLVWWRAFDRRTFAGQLFLASMAVYTGGRLLADAFRANAWLTASGYHVMQILSLVILLVCVFLLGRQIVKHESQNEQASDLHI